MLVRYSVSSAPKCQGCDPGFESGIFYRVHSARMNNYEDKKGVHIVPYQWSGHAGWEGGCAEGPPVLSCTRRMGTLNIIMCQLSIFGIGSSQKTEPRFSRVIRIFRKNLPAVPVPIILRSTYHTAGSQSSQHPFLNTFAHAVSQK